MTKFASTGTLPAVGAPIFNRGPGENAEVSPPLLRPDVVRRHLDQVVVSGEMSRSKKLCQFLRFTVEEVLRGHGSELKEYAIAVGVFKRGREFDPGADPIVRVQARRLRAKLACYYRAEGAHEPIRIEYPIGSYSPIFKSLIPSSQTPDSIAPVLCASKKLEGCCLAVLPFVDLGPEKDQCFCDGLTDELIHTLSCASGLRVVARESSFQFKGRSEDVRRIGQWLGAGALVTGSVRLEGVRLRVLAQLIDAETGVTLWSGVFERRLDGLLSAQEEIAAKVAETLQSHFDAMGSSVSPALQHGAA